MVHLDMVIYEVTAGPPFFNIYMLGVGPLGKK